MPFRTHMSATGLIPACWFLSGIHLLDAAIVDLFQETTAGLDLLQDVDPMSSMISDAGDEVGANVTLPVVNVTGPDFMISGGSGSVSAFRDGPPPGGNRDVSTTLATSVITLTLQPGETLSYNFSMDYDVVANQGGGDPRMGWLFRNATTDQVYFEGSELTTNAATVTESGMITATATETVRLSIIANLNDQQMPPNSEASAAWTSYTFSGDSSIPEPGSAMMLLLGGSLTLFRRRRDCWRS